MVNRALPRPHRAMATPRANQSVLGTSAAASAHAAMQPSGKPGSTSGTAHVDPASRPGAKPGEAVVAHVQPQRAGAKPGEPTVAHLQTQSAGSKPSEPVVAHLQPHAKPGVKPQQHHVAPMMGGPKTIHCAATGQTHTCPAGTRDCYDNSPEYCKPAEVGRPKTIHCSATGQTHTCPGGSRGCFDNSPEYCKPPEVGKEQTIHCSDSHQTHECAAGTRYCYDDSPLYCDKKRPVGHGTKTITCPDGSQHTCHVGTDGCYDGSAALCPRPHHHPHHHPPRPPWIPSSWSWWSPDVVYDPVYYVPLPVYQQLPDTSLLDAIPNLDCIAQYCGQLDEQDAIGCWCGALQSAARDLNQVGVPARAPVCAGAPAPDLVLGTVAKELCVTRS